MSFDGNIVEEERSVLPIKERALLESIVVSMVFGRVRKLTWILPFMTGATRCFESASNKGFETGERPSVRR